MVKSVEKKNVKILLVAQEIELAKLLAGNSKNVRDKALKNLKKWFYDRSCTVHFTEDDFQRIWKGLFYSMWMSDKPLIQEECAENIANLLHFPTYDFSILFFKAGLTILINEWFGIDQLRLDKFLMLVRRFLRHMFMVLKEHGFNKPNIDQFNDVLSDTVLNEVGKIPLGLVMHFTEIYMEELAKVTEGRIHPDIVTELLRPFIRKIATTDDGRQVGQIRKFIFTFLIRQSDLGLEYEAKYNAWKQLGFPGSINSMQKIKLDDDEEISDEDENPNIKQRKPLDPRAGRVDVELPQIKFSAKKIAEALMNYKFDKNSTKRGRNMITVLAKQFSTLANGKYPLGITKLEVKDKDNVDINIRKAANRLIKFEQKLQGKDKRRKRNNLIDEKDLDESSKAKRQKVFEKDTPPKDNVNKGLRNKKQKENENDEKIIQKKEKLKKKVSKVVSEVSEDESVSESAIISEENLSGKNEIGRQKNRLQAKSKKISVDSTKQLKKIKSLECKPKRTKKSKDIDNIECVFERNSGTWVVFDVTKHHLESNRLGIYDKSLTDISPNNSLITENMEQLMFDNTSDRSEELSQGHEFALDTTLNNGIANKLVSPEKLKKPVKLLESPPRGRALFPRTEWDEALQEGEYEVFVPSKMYLKRIQKLAKKNSQKDSQVLVSPSQNNQVKSRRSLDPELIKNPYATPSTRTKKVKINTKLNQSQEFYEHHLQIMSSPGIPHDPNKKPVKPVLKSPARTNSINPFYDKQLNIW